MWEDSKIEQELEQKMNKRGSNGKALYARYIAARTVLNKEILPWIRTIEGSLTDHGPDHIRNVLDNAYQLIGPKSDLNDIELYILCQSILFHDVGNLFGRAKHNLNIPQVYIKIFSELWLSRQEMSLVISIGRSHSGKSPADGSKDTLKDLKNDFYESTNVRAQQLAAILRLADELAEGPQRTSSYLINSHLFNADSHMYHMYASATHVGIDRGGDRIALSYHIELDKFNFSDPTGVEEFSKFMKCIYSRVHKLDGERRYCKHYCDLLNPYKRTSVSFSFWSDDHQMDLAVAPFELDDLFVPGSDLKDIEKVFPNYGIEEMVLRIKQLKGSHDE
ncbi:hypothetical protein ACIQVE_14365 [Pseudomonas sp. NPDC098747]|uniref:HD domain-containing protein n=1 Tax=Pseudomonas sp. NPDC098747 TaxID=3364487 RepID=UPI00383A7130